MMSTHTRRAGRTSRPITGRELGREASAHTHITSPSRPRPAARRAPCLHRVSCTGVRRLRLRAIETSSCDEVGSNSKAVQETSGRLRLRAIETSCDEVGSNSKCSCTVIRVRCRIIVTIYISARSTCGAVGSADGGTFLIVHIQRCASAWTLDPGDGWAALARSLSTPVSPPRSH